MLAAISTSARAEPPPSVELEYHIFLGGLHALSITTQVLRQDDDGYRMEVDAATAGLIGKIVHATYRAESVGVATGGMARPVRFQGISGQDDEIGKTVTLIYGDDGAPEVTFDPAHEAPSDPLPRDMTAATVDPPSAMLTLMETLGASGRCEATVRVFDGKRLYQLVARHKGEVTLSASKYAPYAGPATECRIGFKRIAGFRESKLANRYPEEIVIYLAPLFDDAPPMPVRMHARNLFGALRMHLVSLRGLTAEEASKAR
jgi:hypothetical protein